MHIFVEGEKLVYRRKNYGVHATEFENEINEQPPTNLYKLIGRFYTRGRIIRLDELGPTFVVRLVIRL